MNAMGERLFVNWRILSATLFSVVLIVGAYTFARSVESPPAAQASEETALLEKIAARDSDNDGLPDWEEVLYGTDPKNSDSLRLGMTDGEGVEKGLIVPKAFAALTPNATSTSVLAFDPTLPVPEEGTLTAIFSKNFFQAYVAAVQSSPNGKLSRSETQGVAKKLIDQLAQSVVQAPEFKSAKDLKTAGSGSEALKIFAVSAEAVFLANRANATTSEIRYLKSLLENDDTTAIPHLLSIAKVYKDTSAGLSVLPVPKELTNDMLDIINGMARLSKITEDFTRAGSDPLLATLALKQYPDVLQKFGKAFVRVNAVYRSAGVTFAPDEPGGKFVHLIERVVAKQKPQGPIRP